MAVNKVNYGDEILIDLTEDTVTTDSLLNGVTAHSSNGERIVGNVTVPTKVSELTNDSGYLTAETDPTVPSWAKASSKPTYTASEVGADAKGTAANAVSTHNTNTSAHNDIRLLISELTSKLNALADSDDTTLDQMSEIVAYIKNNKSLIDNITTTKVNVSDIINNLTTNVSNKPLSAAQGVALKALIDAIIVPTKVSELTNDKGYLTAVPSEYVTESELSAKGYATTSQIPTKLPANGGNADTVDGYHIRTASSGDTGKAGCITFIV